MLKHFSKTRLSRRSAGFIKALRNPPLAPATVLCFSFIGFGVLCRGAHIGLAPSLYTTVFIFALPAQVVLVDQIAREIPLWTVALAVAFTGVRLLPMTVSLIPYLRAGRGPRFIDYFIAHFVAVTMWIESMRRIPFLPRGMRLPYYFGLAIILVGVSLAGTVAGYLIADHLPLTVAASLIFLTPAYFLLGLLGNCRRGSDYAPVLLGVCLEPVAAKIAPSFDLVLTGLVAGTASFFIFRRAREAPKPQSVATIPEYRDAG
ncbi:MAG: AzlC family ABC transporter permease [Rhodomicrobium sp.]